jgi:hypothetical protein
MSERLPEKRPPEQEAVMTTIVGGRPPGAGKPVGNIPRGIEVLVKKAAVDPGFKKILLEKRAGAAKEIELTLEASEVAMIDAVPERQLEAIIAKTTVHPKQRGAFLGRVAAVMIVALGASTVGYGCKREREGPDAGEGIRPDRPDVEEGDEETGPPAPAGERPDRPTTKGIRPDRP